MDAIEQYGVYAAQCDVQAESAIDPTDRECAAMAARMFAICRRKKS